MNLLTKQDLETMAANNDQTMLRLHFEGSQYGEPKIYTAKNLLDHVNGLINEHSETIRHNYRDEQGNQLSIAEIEEKIWGYTYICTDADYQLEQSGNL